MIFRAYVLLMNNPSYVLPTKGERAKLERKAIKDERAALNARKPKPKGDM